MKWKFWYKFALLKSYLDAGIGLTGYFKSLIGLAALYEAVNFKNLNFTILIIIIYAIFCFILGWLAYKTGWIEANTEVSNRFNPFVKEMRKKINGKKFK